MGYLVRFIQRSQKATFRIMGSQQWGWKSSAGYHSWIKPDHSSSMLVEPSPTDFLSIKIKTERAQANINPSSFRCEFRGTLETLAQNFSKCPKLPVNYHCFGIAISGL
jgi:hypothetical protein